MTVVVELTLTILLQTAEWSYPVSVTNLLKGRLWLPLHGSKVGKLHNIRNAVGVVPVPVPIPPAVRAEVPAVPVVVGTENTAVYGSVTCDKPHSKDLSIGKAVTIFRFYKLMTKDARGGRGAFSQIFTSAPSSDGTRIFVHESLVLDTSGLAVALELGTNTLHGFVGLHSSRRQMGEQRSLNSGADFVMSHATTGMTGM